MKYIKLFKEMSEWKVEVRPKWSKFNESLSCGNIYFNDEEYPGFMYVKEIQTNYKMYWIGCHSDEIIESDLVKDSDLDVYWLSSPDGLEKFAYELVPYKNFWILDIVDSREMSNYTIKSDYFPSHKGQ